MQDLLFRTGLQTHSHNLCTILYWLVFSPTLVIDYCQVIYLTISRYKKLLETTRNIQEATIYPLVVRWNYFWQFYVRTVPLYITIILEFRLDTSYSIFYVLYGICILLKSILCLKCSVDWYSVQNAIRFFWPEPGVENMIKSQKRAHNTVSLW